MRLPKLGWTGQLYEVHSFELRPVLGGFELRGGQLSEPIVFRDNEPRPAVYLVGFLAQKEGGELRILDAVGAVVQTRRYEPVVPINGAVGGLLGPLNFETEQAIHSNQL